MLAPYSVNKEGDGLLAKPLIRTTLLLAIKFVKVHINLILKVFSIVILGGPFSFQAQGFQERLNVPLIGPYSIIRLASKSCKPVFFIALVCHFTLYIKGRGMIILVNFFFLRFNHICNQISFSIDRCSIQSLSNSIKHPLLFIRLSYKELTPLLEHNFSALARLLLMPDRLIKLCQYFLFSFP